HYLDLFGLGTDRSLFHKAWAPDTGWTSWERLEGMFTSPPVVVTRAPNRLDILGIGRDAAMYQKTWDGSTWLPSPTNWHRLGGGVITYR
ncbi:MAG: M43 family zinc metalloprotease, partial [Nitrospiraceae bacterium]